MEGKGKVTRVKVEEIPQELLDILDDRAGQEHSREGRVVTALAEILTRYDEMKGNEHENHRRT